MMSITARIQNSFNRLYSDVLEVIVRFIQSFFPLLILLWIMSVFLLWGNGFSRLAAAMIGTGPFALYYVYEELVKRPKIVVSKETHYIKKFGSSDFRHKKAVYPVIDVVVDLENVGKKTAKDCSVEVELDGEKRYSGIWDVGQTVTGVDLDPNSSKRVKMMRIFPTSQQMKKIVDDIDNVCHIDEIKSSIDERMKEFLEKPIEDGGEIEESSKEERQGEIPEMPHEVLIHETLENQVEENGFIVTDDYRFLDWDDRDFGGIDVRGLELLTQIPYEEEHQRAIMAQLEMDPSRLFWYIGKYIEPKKEFDVNITVSATDWSKNHDLDHINIDKALDQGKWETKNPQFRPLRRELDRYNWKNKV